MDDWIARRGLAVVDRERLHALSARSDLKGWLQTGSHLGAIGVTTAGLALSPYSLPALWLPILLLHGVLINCLYAGLHECSHWTAFRTKRLNDGFGHLFGFVTLNPFLTDRWSHFAHHRATHDPLRDPELIGTKPYTTSRYLWDLAGVSFWARRIRAILRTACALDLNEAYWLTDAQSRWVVREARIHIAFWVLIGALSLGLASWAAVIFWLAPLLATKVLHQLQNTGEHTGLEHQPDTFRNTRTLIGPAPMRWLVWNMSYHTAHHCFPGVPFHALPALHREIERGLDHPVPARGYLEAQRDILAALSAQRSARRA